MIRIKNQKLNQNFKVNLFIGNKNYILVKIYQKYKIRKIVKIDQESENSLI